MENDSSEKTIKKDYDFADTKGKAKKYYRANKEKIQRRSREYYRNFSEDAKIKIRNYENSRNENMIDVYKEKKNKIRKNIQEKICHVIRD